MLTPEDLAAVQQQVRARVLRWFARAGHLNPVVLFKMNEALQEIRKKVGRPARPARLVVRSMLV